MFSKDCVGCVFDLAKDALASSLRAVLLRFRIWLDIERLLSLFPLLFWHGLPEEKHRNVHTK